MDMFDILNQATSTQDTSVIASATEKINAEIEKAVSEKHMNSAYVQEIGKYLLQQLPINPDLAAKVLIKDKTILKSLDVMRKVAEKRKTGNCAMLTPQEGFDVIMKYYLGEGKAEKTEVEQQ